MATDDVMIANDRVVLVASIASLLAIGLVFANLWLLFGLVVAVLIILEFALGYGAQAKRPAIVITLAATLAALCLLLTGAAWTHNPGEPLRLVGGFPIGTAFFVYGIWPLGLALCLLHTLTFDRSILPEDKLQKLMEEFGERQDS